MAETKFAPEQVAALMAKLDRDVISTREQSGKKLSYIEGWFAISEANRIFGFDAWNRETVTLIETSRDLVKVKGYGGKPDYEQWRVSYLARVRITIGDIVREGTGYGSGMSKPEALGDAIESAAKEAETDAMKRALMTFGNPFGLALYDKTQANVGRGEVTPAPMVETKYGEVDPSWRGDHRSSVASTNRSGKFEDFKIELLETDSIVSLRRFQAEWREIAKRDGWADSVLSGARELIAQQEAAILDSLSTEALADVPLKTALQGSVLLAGE
jgi:DNA recombination protein Rad52